MAHQQTVAEGISATTPRRRRPWGVVAVLFLAVLVQAGMSAAALVLANFGLNNLDVPPAEGPMLARAQQSVVTVNVAGDHFKGSGSGFFIDDAGDILTNFHVIQDAWAVTVTTQSGAVLPAWRMGSNLDDDVAEIRVAAGGPALPFRQLPPEAGEQVYVLGNPGGHAPNSVAKGRVVSVNRSETVSGSNYSHLAMTDAAVQPGNSGSAVIDRHGRLVGMIAVGNGTRGGFIVDSTFATEARSWMTVTPDAFTAPAPDVEVVDWNWTGKYCNPGCGMTADVDNGGGPATATITFSVLSSDKKTTLATCPRQVTLMRSDKTTVSCVVVSKALIAYFNVPYQREVWGDVSVGSVAALPIQTT